MIFGRKGYDWELNSLSKKPQEPAAIRLTCVPPCLNMKLDASVSAQVTRR
jgi:hypothetical protein